VAITINHNIMALNASRNLQSGFRSLSSAVRRLSSGLRIATAADDPAGLAVSELMRSDIAALQQGVRNANDAVSMIQVADGALQVIDEKLIRMRELAEQAATGTYNSDQRLMLHSEFIAMRSEIERIAQETEFNDIKLLNTTENVKIHFGTQNDCSEDYYYINRQMATINQYGLGLYYEQNGNISRIDEVFTNGEVKTGESLGSLDYLLIPQGATDITIHINHLAFGLNDANMQLFTRDGVHLAGTTVGGNDWSSEGVNNEADLNSMVVVEGNGFSADATYDGSQLNGTGADVASYVGASPYNQSSYNGMNIGYSGEDGGPFADEYLHIDEATEDLIFLALGNVNYNVDVSWGSMPTSQSVSLSTQQGAQEALSTIRDAIVTKDNIRADLGATQNRLQNTMSNLQIQAENLQAAESRIRDTDVAVEMTKFVRGQILTQASTAMLAQANSLPRMALQLLGG
jgi:flagellin